MGTGNELRSFQHESFKLFQIELAGKRNKCKFAGIAFLIVLREKGVPKDLARYIIKRFVLSSWLNDIWK